MRYYGYHRTSTKEQHLDRGIKTINDHCNKNNIKLEMMFTDQQTGKNFNRPEYELLKRSIKKQIENNEPCTLIISELDRLGRNKELTLKELNWFKENKVRVMILEIPTTLVDYSNMNNDMATMMMETINNMLIEMYASIAHAEMHKREKRQTEGIQAKKERGEWGDYGRPEAMDFNKFCREYERVIEGQIRPFELIKELGLTKPTFYRYKKKYDDLKDSK